MHIFCAFILFRCMHRYCAFIHFAHSLLHGRKPVKDEKKNLQYAEKHCTVRAIPMIK